MPLKQFHVTYGFHYTLSETIVMKGVSEDRSLTAELACRAARVAAGHTNGVRVKSSDPYEYQLDGTICRKLRDSRR